MFHSKPFKKDLQAFAKGGKVVKHVGKGAKEQSNTSFGSLTGGDALARMANSYPKAAPSGPPSVGNLGGPPMGAPSPVPQGSRPPGAPTAMMPGGGGGEEPDGDEAA